MAEFVPYRFQVSLYAADGANGGGGSGELLARGAFSEVTGLEANMKPKALVEGGRNYGEVQLAGPTSFAPVVLKRGVTQIHDLWAWFEATTQGANYALRYSGRIEVSNPDAPDRPALVWTLDRVLPTKFKGPDLNATSNQVAVEELHLVHEGLSLERPR